MQNERRLHPRYTVNFSVRLTSASSSGEVELTAEAVDLALGGIGIRCSAAELASLQEQSQYPITCRIRFPLPDCGHEISGECRLIARRRLAQNSYLLGFKFTAFEGQSEAQLRTYLQIQ